MQTKSRPLDRTRIKMLTDREFKRLNDGTPKSKATYERARTSMPLGIASSYHWRDPWPIYLTDGKGSKIWDVDGREYIDYLNGFGCMVHGHAHPAIVKAVQDRIARGSQFLRADRGEHRGRGGAEATLGATQVALH